MKAEGLPIVPLPSLARGGVAPLVLLPGRLYYVSILSREGPQAQVALAGHRFTAELVGDLPTAGRVAVTVREAGPERIVLEKAPLPEPTPGPRVSPGPLTDVLQRLGLDSREEYSRCLTELMRTRQPITARSVAELHEAWVRLADANPDSLPLLARLQARGLPLVSETVAASQHWQPPESLPMASSLMHLARSLAVLAQELEAEPMARQLEPLPRFLMSLARSLASLPLTRAGDPTMPGQISGVLQTLGTPVEALVHRLPALPAGSPVPVGGRQEPAPESAGDEVAQTEPDRSAPNPTGLPQQGESRGDLLVRNPGTSRPAFPTLEQNLQVQLRRLAPVLDRLREAGEGLSLSSRQTVLEAREAVHGVLADLEAQQVGNLRPQPDSGNPGYFFFSLPISWSGPKDEAALRVYYRPGEQRRVDPSNTHLAFRLSVAPLGVVEVDLRVFRGTISCDVRTEDEATNQMAIQTAPRLEDGLRRLGFLIGGVKCRIAGNQLPASGDDPNQPTTELALVDVMV